MSLLLLTNDDGVGAEGLRTLAEALRDLGRVVVVAPDRERSAASHSITLHRPLRVTEHGRDRFAVDGTPTDCTYLGIHELAGARPDLVVSGINHGANIGEDVHYSGTVSGAKEALLYEVPAIAVSQMPGPDRSFAFAPIARFVRTLAAEVLAKGLPGRTLLNVNGPVEATTRWTWTRQGSRSYQNKVEMRLDPRGRRYYWIGGGFHGSADVPGSDGNALKAGLISVTPLQLDLTHHAVLPELSRWRLPEFEHT